MQEGDKFIFCVRAVIEALDAEKEIDKVLIKRGGGSDLFREMLQKLREHNTIIQYVPIEKLNALTRKNHQGVVAFMAEISYGDLAMILPGVYESGEVPLILILDKISDVRNFGAVARTAECAGVHAIVIPIRGSARINAEAVKTSAGSLHNIPVCRYENLVDTLKFLKESGLKICAATDKASTDLYKTDMDGSNEDVYGWNYHNHETNTYLLLIND